MALTPEEITQLTQGFQANFSPSEMTLPDGTVQPQRQIIDQQSAQELADRLGAKLGVANVQGQFSRNIPEYHLVFDNGAVLDATQVARFLSQGHLSDIARDIAGGGFGFSNGVVLPANGQAQIPPIGGPGGMPPASGTPPGSGPQTPGSGPQPPGSFTPTPPVSIPQVPWPTPQFPPIPTVPPTQQYPGTGVSDPGNVTTPGLFPGPLPPPMSLLAPSGMPRTYRRPSPFLFNGLLDVDEEEED